MALQNLFFITIVLCIFAIGCEPEKTANPVHQQLSENSFEVVSAQPDSPAELALGQKFNIQILYDLNTVDKATIWARPYNNGRKTPNYHAHHLIPVGQDGKKEGLVTGWFFFEKPAEVDEVKIFVKDVKTDKMLKEISYPVSLKWL